MSLAKKEIILITGATGTLGRRIVKEILRSQAISKIILLVRGETNKAARERVFEIIKQSKRKVIDVYASDITKNNLGLNDQVYDRLSKEVTSILHCAANVRFSLPLEEAMAVNYQGTTNLLEFAKDCQELSKFGHVSTAFVAGKRKGFIYEDELEHNAGFINSYEQSKYETELLVRSNFDNLPINIFRPTILIDDESRNAVNYMLKLFYEKSLPFIPGDKKGCVDLVQPHYCASVIWKIFDTYFTASKTYHIAAGPENSYTLEDLVDKVTQAFSSYKTLNRPKFVRLSEFQTLFLKKLSDTKIGVFRKLDTFATQLLYPKIFDTRNVETLKDTQLQPKHVDAYFGDYLLDFLNKER
jgi:long-chain acyl-CoA synthetase